jgi:hypothetical protein
MNADGVSTAFQIILEEIDAVVSEVNAQGAAYLRNDDYSSAKSSISAGEKLKDFRVKLDILKEEWVSGLDESTRNKVQIEYSEVRKTIASSSKSSKTILVVKFKDGTVLFESKANETFAKALKRFGLERVSSLGIKVNNFDLISKHPSKHYSQTEVDGYLIMTHSSTEAKRDKLLEIAKALKYEISVDIVPTKEN